MIKRKTDTDWRAKMNVWIFSAIQLMRELLFGMELRTESILKKFNKERADCTWKKQIKNKSHLGEWIVIYHTDKTKNKCEEKGTETLLSYEKN